MKKIFLFLILALSVVASGCEEKQEQPFDNYSFFMEHPEYYQKIVEVENRKAPLNAQEYNKIKNNVVKIEFKKLTITHGTNESCKGYFTTVWTIKSEYFSEEEYEYLLPLKSISYNPKTKYTTWGVEWPKEHPFIDVL